MHALSLLAAITLVLSGCSTIVDPVPEPHVVDLSRHFEGVNGCFVSQLIGVKGGRTLYNERRCAQRFSPCSTFKIPNSLIALEVDAIADENEILKWDGRPNDRAVADQDHTLKTALQNSIVWFYQELAQRIGEQRYKYWLAKLDYGNRDISGGLTQFWLTSSLKISANEQVDFLARFATNDLPFSKRSCDIVRRILIQQQTAEYTYRGKTGSGRDPDLGWWVGWIEFADGRTFVFACNVTGEDAFGPKAREIAESILRERGVLPAASE